MTFHAPSSTVDVIVSGAGPVGLFLACELALAKCSVRVLEKSLDPNSPLKQLPFGLRGLSAPSIDTLDRRGLLEALEVPKRLKDPHSHAVQGQRRLMGHFAGIPFEAGHIDASQWKYRLPDATDGMLLSEMQELETVLARRAEAMGVDIRRGYSLSDFQQNDAGVTVIAGDESMSGRWLVGCDGSRSVVRKIAGFEFAGTEPEFTGYSARVDIVDPKKLLPGRNLTPTGMYLQSQPGYLVLQDFDGGAFHGSGAPITLDHVQEVLRRISGTDVSLSALHIATTWTDRARQATAYRQGRVLLAGDAAHIHAPLGGQGLNLGLGDAMNLGWKLAATIHDRAPPGLLDSYETERHPLGVRVLDWSRAQALVMRPDPDARALNSILRDLMQTRDGATYFAGRVWGVTAQYDFGSDHPLVGRSAPNIELTDGTTLAELMRDGKGLLLQFHAGEFAKTLANDYGDRITFVSGRARATLGLSSLLIRPDGFVAWACDHDDLDKASLRDALQRWFGADGKTRQGKRE